MFPSDVFPSDDIGALDNPLSLDTGDVPLTVESGTGDDPLSPYTGGT